MSLLRLASWLVLLATCLTLAPVGAQEAWRAEADVAVRYRIQASLIEVPDEDGEDRWRIVGRQWIEWRNATDVPATSLYFHLYPNAFRNTATTFMREALQNGEEIPDDVEWGELSIQRLSVTGGPDLQPEFVSPDDGNREDRTVARVTLPEPVAPGDTIGVEMGFVTLLPSVIARMGQHRDFVMAAQWYPKLGRFLGGADGDTSEQGWTLSEGWYCNQYHYRTEFYADYADYDVQLTLPADMHVGASGQLAEEPTEDEDAGVKSLRFRSESVVDFAWTADANFVRQSRVIKPAVGHGPDDAVVRERRRLSSLLGIPEEDFALPNVRVALLLQPEHADQAERHFEAARVALSLFGMWFGPYPYETLTIVDPPAGAEAAGGMEYPRLVTAGTRVGSPPESLRPEGVIVHEILHQWFMNLLASNEAEEAWLDEGLTTYFTARALHLCYGPAVRYERLLGHYVDKAQIFDFPGVSAGWPGELGLPQWAKPGEMEIFAAWRDLPWLTGVPARRYVDDPLAPRRESFLRRASWDPIVRPGWRYKDGRSYGVNAYSRPALFLATLRRRLREIRGAAEGERAFHTALRSYAREYRFRHPTTRDFFRVFDQAAEFETEPLVTALFESTGLLDYAVESIARQESPRLRGIGARAAEVRAAPEAPHRTEVVLRRRGEVIVPVTVRATREPFEDEAPGPKHVTLRWDGRDRWKRYVLDGDVTSVRIDPDRVYPQDVDLRNNSLVQTPSYRPAAKWSVRFLIWLENALVSYGRFF